MPFTKITRGPQKGKYRSPSGRVFAKSQVKRYYARGGSFDSTPMGEARFWCDAVKRTSDPTGTIDIRKRFGALLAMRWRKVRTALQAAVVTQDVLGLKPATVSPLAIAGSTGNRELGFQTWFDNLLKKLVVEDGAWMRPLVQASYNRAIKRAMRLTRTDALPTDQTETVDALVTLCYTELQGIAEAVSQRVMRAATQGWLHNDTPAEAFRDMDVALKVVGITRSNAMSELMVVKTFNTATLDQFAAAKIAYVGLIAEARGMARPGQRRDSMRDAGGGPGSRISRTEPPSRSTIGRIRAVATKLEEAFGAEGPEEQDPNVLVQTAGDEDVCPICQDIEDDNPYTLDEARSLIPAHPNCRCAFVPDEEEQGFFGKVFGAIKGFFGGLFGGDALLDYNENHDPQTGQFTFGEGGGEGGKGVVTGSHAAAAITHAGLSMVPDKFVAASGVTHIRAYDRGRDMQKDFPGSLVLQSQPNKVLGMFNEKTNRLGLNAGAFKYKEAVAGTLAHELAHAYDAKNGRLSLTNKFYKAFVSDRDAASTQDRSVYAHYFSAPTEAFAEGSSQLIMDKLRTAGGYGSLALYAKAFPNTIAYLKAHYTEKGLL